MTLFQIIVCIGIVNELAILAGIEWHAGRPTRNDSTDNQGDAR